MWERPVAAVAGVIVDGGKILLIRRGKEPSKGKWSVPGGSVELGETLAEAVKREVHEETGLDVEAGSIAGVYDLIIREEDQIRYQYVIIDYFARVVGGSPRPGDDAAEVLWVPLNELGQYELTPHLRERLKDMGVGGNG